MSGYSRRLNTSELLKQKVESRISELVIFIEDNKFSKDWYDAIEYVLKHEEQPHHFNILEIVIEKMTQVDISVFQKTTDIATDLLDHTKSLRAFLLLLGTILSYGSSSLTYNIQRSFQAAIKKFGLLSKQIAELEGIPSIKYPTQISDAVKIGITNIKEFLKRVRDFFEINALITILGWVNIFPVLTLNSLYELNDFCEQVVKALLDHRRASMDSEREKVVVEILTSIIRFCGHNYEGTDHYFMVIDRIPDALLQGAILNGKDRFAELKHEDYLKFFNVITRSSVSPRTLTTILHFTELLRRDQDFFALKILYEEFLLPKIILGSIKYTTVAQEEVRELTRKYVYGLQNHAGIVKEQLSEIVDQLSDHEQTYVDFWLKIAFLLAHPNQALIKFLSENISTIRDLTKMSDYLNEAELQQIRSLGWPLNGKPLQQKKRYLSRKSSLVALGSQTDGHITSIIELLYISRHFYDLLKHHESDYTESSSALKAGGGGRTVIIKSKIIFELKELFDRLKSQQRCNIDKIVTFGPGDFKSSKQPKDCAKYLQSLFDMLNSQFKKFTQSKTDMLTEFNGLFLTTASSTVQCVKCKYLFENSQNAYLFTLPKGEFTTEWNEETTFKCAKCSSDNSKQPLRYVIQTYPEIFLAKIQRFEVMDGRIVKNMEPYTIPRRLKAHYLAGFICHIGTDLANAKYVLFYRKQENPRKWLKFQGQSTNQFQTSDDNEQIQRSFPADCTPYILVYQKYQRK